MLSPQNLQNARILAGVALAAIYLYGFIVLWLAF